MPMATSNQKWSHSCPESHILAWWFTKRQVGMPDECLLLRVFGNCWASVKLGIITSGASHGDGVSRADNRDRNISRRGPAQTHTPREDLPRPPVRGTRPP